MCSVLFFFIHVIIAPSNNGQARQRVGTGSTGMGCNSLVLLNFLPTSDTDSSSSSSSSQERGPAVPWN
ncbi:hypothetical protein INR49_010917 [Caranx melampygus]|nr:hypothetical protein INR49_010917 [Caranx melampygus]